MFKSSPIQPINFFSKGTLTQFVLNVPSRTKYQPMWWYFPVGSFQLLIRYRLIFPFFIARFSPFFFLDIWAACWEGQGKVLGHRCLAMLPTLTDFLVSVAVLATSFFALFHLEGSRAGCGPQKLFIHSLNPPRLSPLMGASEALP